MTYSLKMGFESGKLDVFPYTHYSAQEHGLWRIKSGILHQSYLFHYGLHVIHLRAKQNALSVTKSNMKHR